MSVQVATHDKRPPLEACHAAPASLKRLLQACWARNPRERPSSGAGSRPTTEDTLNNTRLPLTSWMSGRGGCHAATTGPVDRLRHYAGDVLRRLSLMLKQLDAGGKSI